jgi:hypothetical protein
MIEFRIVSAICILGVIAAIVIDLRIRLRSWGELARFFVVRWEVSREIWRSRKSMRTDPTLAIVRRFVYQVAYVLFLLLATTAFVPVLFVGEHLSGALLVIHVTLAPFFALTLAGLALLWAQRLRFRSSDWHIPKRLVQRQLPEATPVVRFIVKAGFWLVLVLSLPLMLSIIFGLYPWFGTEGQEFLRTIHGYSALALIVVILVHTHVLMTYVESSVEQFMKENKP